MLRASRLAGPAPRAPDVAEHRVHPTILGTLDRSFPAAHHQLMNAACLSDDMETGQPIGEHLRARTEVLLRPGGDLSETEALDRGELHTQRMALLIWLDRGDPDIAAGAPERSRPGGRRPRWPERMVCTPCAEELRRRVTPPRSPTRPWAMRSWPFHLCQPALDPIMQRLDECKRTLPLNRLGIRVGTHVAKFDGARSVLDQVPK